MRAVSREQAIKALTELAAEQVGVDPATIGLDTCFHADLGFDSLDDVEYAMTVEEAFDIQVSDEQAQQVRCVRDALALLAPALVEDRAATA